MGTSHNKRILSHRVSHVLSPRTETDLFRKRTLVLVPKGSAYKRFPNATNTGKLDLYSKVLLFTDSSAGRKEMTHNKRRGQ